MTWKSSLLLNKKCSTWLFDCWKLKIKKLKTVHIGADSNFLSNFQFLSNFSIFVKFSILSNFCPIFNFCPFFQFCSIFVNFCQYLSLFCHFCHFCQFPSTFLSFFDFVHFCDFCRATPKTFIYSFYFFLRMRHVRWFFKHCAFSRLTM